MSKAAIPMKRKQAILDHLNEHGKSSSRQIGGALGISKGAVNSYLREMRIAQEVLAHEVYQGRVLAVTYTALVTKTATGLRIPAHKGVTRTTAHGGIVHLGTERDHPLPNAGGQGNIRYDFGIQSSAGLL